jgi:5,10-methylenetetrahydromethanopterin reductase
VLIPSNRIAPVAANAFATLNALAPRRIRAGVGTGFTGRLTMGLGPYPLRNLEQYVRVMQALLRGETVTASLEGMDRKVRFLHPEAGLINIGDPIPVSISAFGPKGRQLTARLGADWINVSADVTQAVMGAQQMNDAWRAAGHDPTQKRRILFLWGSVLADAERSDSPRVIAESGPFAVQVLHAMIEAQDRRVAAGVGSDDEQVQLPFAAQTKAYRKIYESYEPADARYLTLHRGHLLFIRPEEQHFVTAKLIESTTTTGTVAELRERIRALAAAGYDEIVAGITPGHESMIEDWKRVFDGV